MEMKLAAWDQGQNGKRRGKLTGRHENEGGHKVTGRIMQANFISI